MWSGEEAFSAAEFHAPGLIHAKGANGICIVMFERKLEFTLAGVSLARSLAWLMKEGGE